MRDFVPSEPVAPERIWKWRTPIRRFGSESTISRFGERFRDGQYSLVSFSFAVLLLTVPPRAQPFVIVGAHAPVPHGVGATAQSSWLGPLLEHPQSTPAVNSLHCKIMDTHMAHLNNFLAVCTYYATILHPYRQAKVNGNVQRCCWRYNTR